MNVGFYSPNYPGIGPDGGIGTYTRQLAWGLAEAGHGVHVVTPGEGGRVADGPVQVHRISTAYLPLADRVVPGCGACLRAGHSMRRIVREARLDLVEFANWEGLGIGFAARRPTPMVVRLSTSSSESAEIDGTSGRIARWDARRERWSARMADALVTHSAAHARTMADEVGVAPTAIQVAPLAVEVDRTFARPGGLGDDLTVAYVGRLERRKGTVNLLRAAADVVRAEPRARFVLVGADRPHCPGGRTHARFLAEEMPAEVRARVSLAGRLPQSEVDAILQRADLFVAPSLYESFGLVFLEAMRWGTPVVGTTAGGIPEVVEDGRSGRLVAPGDVVGLAATIVALLRDEDQRRRLGEAGRRRVESRFTVEAMTRRAVDLYERVIEENR